MQKFYNNQRKSIQKNDDDCIYLLPDDICIKMKHIIYIEISCANLKCKFQIECLKSLYITDGKGVISLWQLEFPFEFTIQKYFQYFQCELSRKCCKINFWINFQSNIFELSNFNWPFLKSMIKIVADNNNNNNNVIRWNCKERKTEV